MSPVAGTLAAWWGLADADPVILGLAVAAVAALSLTYVGLRVVRARKSGPKKSGGTAR